jgi:HK97 family phage prohead protease
VILYRAMPANRAGATVTPITAAPSAQHTGRTVTGLCVPLDEVHEIATPGGGSFLETIPRGAFAANIAAPIGVTLRLSHSPDEVVRLGNAATLTETDAGLLAEFTADPSSLGDWLLAEVAAGVRLSLSVGMVPLAQAITWHGTRPVRTYRVCHLDHVAIVARPAYPRARLHNTRRTPERLSA